MSTFNNATLMITGGTGSFGSTVLKHFLDSDLKEIRIFSRDEKKQDDMRHELQAKHPENAKKVKFYIGDVRNPQSIRDAMPGVDYIFHAAALKQVPSCEFFPMQAVQTNIIGTDNVLHAAIDAGVKRVVCLSTDKAAYPINAMGISKAMMEHVIYANARVAAERGGTTICCTRYGDDYISLCDEVEEFYGNRKLITHYGGEFFAASSSNAKEFVNVCEQVYSKMLEKDFRTTKGDEFILSVAAENMKASIKNAGAYVYRFWTGASFRLVSTCYEYNRIIVLHLPAEKEHGMLKMYDHYIRRGIVPSDKNAWRIFRLSKMPLADQGKRVLRNTVLKKV